MKKPELFPILCTCPGPDFHKPAVVYDPKTGEVMERFMSQIPIPEGMEFDVQYGPYSIRFSMDMRFSTDDKTAMIELVSVSK